MFLIGLTKFLPNNQTDLMTKRCHSLVIKDGKVYISTKDISQLGGSVMINYDSTLSKIMTRYAAQDEKIMLGPDGETRQQILLENNFKRTIALQQAKKLYENWQQLQTVSDSDNTLSMLAQPLSDPVYSVAPSNVRAHIDRRAMTESAWASLYIELAQPLNPAEIAREKTALSTVTTAVQVYTSDERLSIKVPQKSIELYARAGLDVKQIGALVTTAFSESSEISHVGTATFLDAFASELGSELDYMTSTPTRLQELHDVAQKVVQIRDVLANHGANISYRDAMRLRSFDTDELVIFVDQLRPVTRYPGTTLVRLAKEASAQHVSLENLVDRATSSGNSPFDEKDSEE